VGPCLGRPSDPPGNLSGVVFGATKIQRLFARRESSGTQNHYKRLSNPNLNTRVSSCIFEPIHEQLLRT